MVGKIVRFIRRKTALQDRDKKGDPYMVIKNIAKIGGGQDGAVYGAELFRLDEKGNCSVYDLSGLRFEGAEELKPFAQFRLDRADEIVPHSNAVCFGCEFYEQGDVYPLLYSNVYNNYANAENKRIGVCLVYRLARCGNEFRSTLVQCIEIGFCEDASLWKATAESHGVRPYGNFVVDTDTRSLWAFVMRNETLGTRYFRFDLPSVHDGETDAALAINKVILRATDIRATFDCAYHRFIQGATLHGGKIYSTEGFGHDEINRPAIRVVDTEKHSEEYFDIAKLGYWNEPECISFYGDRCLWGDIAGNAYEVVF